MKLHWKRALWVHKCVVFELGERATVKGYFDFALRMPSHQQSREIVAMKKTLRSVFRKRTTRRLRYADIYINCGRVVKVLRTDKYLERTIRHLGYTFLGLAVDDPKEDIRPEERNTHSQAEGDHCHTEFSDLHEWKCTPSESVLERSFGLVELAKT
jgi:hypothetical protein